MRSIPGETYVSWSTADQVITSNTTLADVIDLGHAVGPGEIVRVSINMMFTLAGSLSGYKFSLNAPASPAFVQIEHVISNVSSGLPIAGSLVQAVATLLTGSLTTAGTYSAKWTGLISNGVNAGTIQLQAAQNASNASALTLLKGSSISMQRLG